jgi:Flp pilus assembly pilin Flp|tara:strand:+ start:476 stop:784 length:309 start_codon:yes stop_codon:yes gene_type:complete
MLLDSIGPLSCQAFRQITCVKTAAYEFHRVCRQPKEVSFDKAGVCSRTQRKLQADTAGSVLVEYTVLMALVAVGASAAIYAIGLPLVARYQFMKMLIGLPLP